MEQNTQKQNCNSKSGKQLTLKEIEKLKELKTNKVGRLIKK